MPCPHVIAVRYQENSLYRYKRRKAVASIFRLEGAYFFATPMREQGWHHDDSSLVGIPVDFFLLT